MTLALPDPRPVRAPSIQVCWVYARFTCHLAYIWLEVWPFVLGTLAIAGWQVGRLGLSGLSDRWALAAYAVAVIVILCFWCKGAIRKNVGDTYAAMVRCDWRIARLTKPTLPRLVKVEVHEPYGIRRAIKRRSDEGIWGLPAAAAAIEFRPHPNEEPTLPWVQAIESWATNRYAFSSWETRPTRRSPHILRLGMGELVIPDMVTAGDWEG